MDKLVPALSSRHETTQYIAPEVIKGSGVFVCPKPHNLKVDNWGLGVILYSLPFSEDSRSSMTRF